MARPSKFPITVKAGATAIKIYRSPQLVKIAAEPNAPPAAGKKPKVVTYDSYVVVHYRGGQRVNAGRKVRRGHGCDRAVQKCGAFMNNEACIALWKTGPTYGNGWPRAR